jgi:hypothetical protein
MGQSFASGEPLTRLPDFGTFEPLPAFRFRPCYTLGPVFQTVQRLDCRACIFNDLDGLRFAEPGTLLLEKGIVTLSQIERNLLKTANT